MTRGVALRLAELVRSGVYSMPAGHCEAGLSIGLTPTQTLRSIQLPQALTAMLFILIDYLLTRLATYVERRLKRGGKGRGEGAAVEVVAPPAVQASMP